MASKEELRSRIKMVTEAIKVHDAECCSSARPCGMRSGLSATLSRYQKAVGATPAAPLPSTIRIPVTEPGMYRRDGRVYKVKFSGNGRLYAEVNTPLVTPVMMANGKQRMHKFVYDRGAIMRLSASDRMTVEDAENWSADNGACCRCGITLTASIGIGPVCRKKI
ncbi:MAG: hypothetical protein EPO09_21540 [Aquabacterium sp.]|uniref:hypothetical protein n=1 Tax=Aquabacterium sp. TaxID=1872578 RepID=UPI0011FF4355|nr:hypothetical protein [Aquabacterium sp.]TAK82629.1 MAG: hypothetical protein EPO09_21540 [Aquabacterium sp.]